MGSVSNMRIDDIIEQHKEYFSKREQLRKSKSFSNIVWKDYPSSFKDSFVRKIALPLFPLVASLVLPFALVGEVAIDEKIPGFVISSFFSAFLLPKSMAVSDSKNTKRIVRLEVLTLVFNLITLYMLDWNCVLVFWLGILYSVSFYSIFKKPFIEWWKVNKI